MTRLHYLYDHEESSKEGFVYYCSNCSSVLQVRRDFWPTLATIDSPDGRCLGCGCRLEDSIKCRLVPVPYELSDTRLTDAVVFQRKTANFRSASSFPHFSLGLPCLDLMMEPFSSQRLFTLSGGAASAVAELTAFRAQLPLEAGGLDSNVLFVDGGNRSDPYLFSSFAKQFGLKPEVAMRRVATCRIFTIYQLADLVSERLVRSAQDYAAGLIVISDLLGTFNEPELEEREARRLLSAVEGGIERLKKNSLVLATLASPNKHDNMIIGWADVAVSLSSSRGRVQAELIKHPTKPPTASSFTLNQLLEPVRVTR